MWFNRKPFCGSIGTQFLNDALTCGFFPIPTTIEFFLFGGLGLTLWVRPKIGDFPPKLGNAWEYVAKENGKTLGNLGLPSNNFNIMETGPNKHSVILPYFTSQFPW